MATTTSKRIVSLQIQAVGLDAEGKKATSALKSIESQANRTTSTFGKMSAGLASLKKFALPVVATLAAGAVGLTKLGTQFEGASKSISVATGATGDALEGLNDDLKAIYATADQQVNLSTVADLVGTLNTLTGEAGPALQELGVQIVDVAGLLEENANAIGSSFGRSRTSSAWAPARCRPRWTTSSGLPSNTAPASAA